MVTLSATIKFCLSTILLELRVIFKNIFAVKYLLCAGMENIGDHWSQKFCAGRKKKEKNEETRGQKEKKTSKGRDKLKRGSNFTNS